MKKLGLAGLAGILLVLLGLMLGGGPTVMGLLERAAQVVGPDIAQAAAQGAWLPIQNNPCNAQMRLFFYDEDTMGSDDACGVASQESIKAYVDSQAVVGSGGAINGDTADEDTNIYGNATIPVIAVDAGNKRVGINVAAPTVPLDVLGAVLITGGLTQTGAIVQSGGAVGLKGTVTINGSTLDQNTIIYGNSTTELLHADAGDMRIGINDSTPSYSLDVTGTARVTSTLIAGGTVTMTGPVTIATYKVPYTLKVDTTHVIQSGTTVLDAATLAYTLADTAGGVIEVLCGGTASGTTDAATLTVTAGSTVICTLANDAADTGHWQFNATIAVVAGGTVKTTCVLNQATQADVDAGYATTAIDLSAVTAWAVTLDLAGTTDDISKEMCIWKKAN